MHFRCGGDDVDVDDDGDDDHDKLILEYSWTEKGVKDTMKAYIW